MVEDALLRNARKRAGVRQSILEVRTVFVWRRRGTNLRVVLRATNRTNQVAGQIAVVSTFEFETTLVVAGGVAVLLAHVVERI